MVFYQIPIISIKVFVYENDSGRDQTLPLVTKAPREKCPYLEFFWFVHSRIRTKYGDLLCKSLFMHWKSKAFHVDTNNDSYCWESTLFDKFVKNDLFSTMRKDRSNGLMLFDIHKDLVLDYEIIINLFANKYQRKMLMVYPLEQLMKKQIRY